MNKKIAYILAITGIMVFIFCMVASRMAIDKINQSFPAIINIDEDNQAYSYYSKSLKVNNIYYQGSPFVMDNESDTIYMPLSDLSSLLGEDTWTNELPESIRVINYKGESYVSIESMVSSNILNMHEDDNGLLYIDNFKEYDYSWVSENRVVAHALGGIDNHKYTNCKEALEANYDAGYRVFEVDIMLSSDGIPVFGHDWTRFYSITNRSKQIPNNGEDPDPLSFEEYAKSTIYDKYTPLTMEELALFMSQHPDMYVITDTKAGDAIEARNMFESIVLHVSDVDASVLDRFIPQIYDDEMLEAINEVYEWKSIIYTLYNLPDDFSYQDVFDFSYENGIRVFTFSGSRSNTDFIRYISLIGGYAYMHTFNDEDTARRLIENKGVYGIYSDYIDPDFYR